VFNKETISKARRRWRLLFIDGHGSHLNLKFVNRCLELKIRHSINRVVAHSSPRTQRTIKSLSRAYYRQSGDLKIERLENIQLRDFLALERRQKKRQKRLFEQLRANDCSATLFISHSKVQRARDIADIRKQEKEQPQQDRLDRAAARATAKTLKEAEAQLKHRTRTTARAEKQQEAATKKAALQKD
jgi:hypothetical protein